MSTVLAACNGTLQTLQDGAIACSGSWQSIQSAATMAPFDPATLNPAQLAGAFGAGFTVVATMACIGIVVGHILKILH